MARMMWPWKGQGEGLWDAKEKTGQPTARQQKQEREATAGWKRVRPTHLPLPPHGAAELDRRCNWALQGTPSGPPGNSLLTGTHSRLLLRLLRRSNFYGSTPSSSGFMVPSATSGPQPCLRLTSMTAWHSLQSSLCLGQPGREGVMPVPSFCLGLTQKQGLSTRPDPSLVII